MSGTGFDAMVRRGPTPVSFALRRPVLAGFLLIVVLPTILYALYLLLLASPRYESGFRIQIKAPGQAMAPNVGQLFGLSGVSTVASDNGYAVVQYLDSTDAVADLDRRVGLRSRYRSESIDRISRLGRDDSIEAVRRYWSRHLSAHYENTTATVIVDVTAFTPKDAYDIARSSLALSENLLNSMTERSRRDSVRYAEREVQRAEQRVRDVEQRLFVTRSQKQVIDASKQVTSAMTRIATLQQAVDQAEADVAVRTRYLAPGAPGRDLAEARLGAARAALADAQGRLANPDGAAQKTLAGTVSAFDALESEKVFAEKRLQNALASLTAAESDAQRQQLYLDTIVHPRMPEEASYPKFFKDIAIFFLMVLAGWGILSAIGLSVRDHVSS